MVEVLSKANILKRGYMGQTEEGCVKPTFKISLANLSVVSLIMMSVDYLEEMASLFLKTNYFFKLTELVSTNFLG